MSRNRIRRGTAPLVILGAGGHARVLGEAARALRIPVRAFLDDDEALTGTDVNGVPVAGQLRDWVTFPAGTLFAIGIGTNRLRQTWADTIARGGGRAKTLIHPSAIVAPSATIEEGAYVGPLAVVHVNARAGRHSIINTAAVVDHQCVVADFAHTSANVIMGGKSETGEGSLLGVGCSLLPGVRVGAWSEIGAGSVVTRDMKGGVVAYGVPARIRRPSRS